MQLSKPSSYITPASHSWFCIDLASQLGILMVRPNNLAVSLFDSISCVYFHSQSKNNYFKVVFHIDFFILN